MSFLALLKEDLTEDDAHLQSGEAKVFISPMPSIKQNEYPTIWIDLHLAGDSYEICGKDIKHNFKKNNESLIISIRSGRSLRLKTTEKIGIGRGLTGIVVNNAGLAVRGLFLAPGKVDPGYRPSELTLVVTNHARRSIDLKAGDKIATIAFAQASAECAPTKSSGWANRKIDGYTLSTCERIRDRLRNIDIFDTAMTLLIGAIGAALALIVKFFLDKMGLINR